MREAERETQLRSHLREIDDRLEQAIRSRNEYVDYLRSKYPNLSAERFETAEERSLSCGKPRGVHRIITRDPGNPDPFAQSMLILTPQEAAPSRLRDELRTNVYHWDLGRRAPPPRFVTPPGPLPRVSDPIPSNGLVLQSDLPRIRARLAEIKSDLADLRDQRMFMSSADYHRTILPSREPFLSTLNALQGPQGLPGDSYNQYAVPKRSDRSFAEILNRLTEITEETPTEEVPPPRALLANPNSHRDTQIDRMFEKVRGQVEDTVPPRIRPLMETFWLRWSSQGGWTPRSRIPTTTFLHRRRSPNRPQRRLPPPRTTSSRASSPGTRSQPH
uniref:Uncharacterized protein n=1 Tax=Steinernema glaseri TaxID=37863 RepID=A0A1I7YKY4_9BILA